MKCHGIKWLHHAVCIITALGSIHVGLLSVGYNVLAMGFLAGLAKPIEAIFGLVGLLSIVLLVMHSMCCGCGCCSTCETRKM
jgi:uncharacterized membrane protein YuzA (DUF378 family)